MNYLLLITVVFLTGCAESGRMDQIDATCVMGDSISIGYQPYLAHSVHNPGNAGRSQYTRDNVQDWLRGKVYKAIVFNNGLHDVIFLTSEFETHKAVYKENIEFIADVVLHATTHPIFVLSTFTNDPQHPEWVTQTQAYNAIAREVMERKGIKVIDLYAVSFVNQAHIADTVHFDDVGYQLLANEISKELP